MHHIWFFSNISSVKAWLACNLTTELQCLNSSQIVREAQQCPQIYPVTEMSNFFPKNSFILYGKLYGCESEEAVKQSTRD